MKLSRKQMKLACTITLAVVSCTSYSSLLWAQPAKPTNSIPDSRQVRWRSPPQPQQQEPDFSGDGRPGRRAGGGSRSPCPSKDIPLNALIPVTNSGKTVAAHPTFWVYVPYSPQEVNAGEFVLQDENYNDVYRTPVTLPKTPGLVSLNIPPREQPLEINKWYFWSFKIYCQPQKLSAPVFVEGWVQRIAPTPELERQLKATATRDYFVYANNGIWYDAIARLAELRRDRPPNAMRDRDWTQLLSLRGIGLERLNQKPIIGSAIQLAQDP